VGGAALFEEDATAVTAVIPNRGRQRVFVNGKGHSLLPYGNIHTDLGAVPAAMHRSPEEIAIIGLGSGETAWAAAFREETRHFTVFEIAKPEQRLLERLLAQRPIPDLRRLLRDSRLRIVNADGRNAFLHSDARYDVIEADALRPRSAYAGNIYSVEFFQLAASRLKEGGLMCTWMPTERVYRSFIAAFPHVVEFDRQVLVLRSGRRVDPERSAELLANRDLFPRDEYRTPSDR
jgi:spermidine synthase